VAANGTITRVPGLRVGHAGDAHARTGCTVLLGPFRGACIVSGLATGTRELDVFNPNHVVESIDALLLTGGSAYGLGAAMGVVEWLRERGIGFQTPAAAVPIVPAAVIYDLGVGRSDRWPDPAMARAACDAASDAPLAEGAVGAGTGATVGKMLGAERAARGGVGSTVDEPGDAGAHIIGALAVVNALGDVLDARGGILAGPRLDDGSLAASAELIRKRGTAAFAGAVPPSNTTLTVVATDAPLGRTALAALARMAATALPRRISPVHTPFDGDITFALSTAPEPRPVQAADLFTLGVRAAGALERAIERAVSVPS
jgi:L-aminopeptidase/D-esterase-like protein